MYTYLNTHLSGVYRMSEIEPRTHIAEEWAKKAACPVCHGHGLGVNHTVGVPDRAICPTCRVTYEISEEFTHIRLTRLPIVAISQRIDLLESWITPVELEVIIAKSGGVKAGGAADVSPFFPEIPARPESRSILASLPPMTQDEVTRRVLTLRALGNKLEAIRLMMTDEGATEDQMRGAEAALAQVQEDKRRRRWRSFWVITAVSSLVIIAVLAWLILSGTLSMG